MSWLILGNHVIPSGDTREHLESDECWCNPTYDEYVVVHHSADQRELYERGERKAS